MILKDFAAVELSTILLFTCNVCYTYTLQKNLNTGAFPSQCSSKHYAHLVKQSRACGFRAKFAAGSIAPSTDKQ